MEVEKGIWTWESHLTRSDWLQERSSPTQWHNLLCLGGIQFQLSKMFMPILSGKVSSNRPWNHETENYSLLKLYRLLRKNTVGIWLEINLASTKTKLSSDFHGGNHILVQEKPEGILFKPDCQRVGATPPNSLSVWHMFTWVINLNCSEERKTSLVYVDWEHSGEKIIEHHFLRPLKQWNICK